MEKIQAEKTAILSQLSGSLPRPVPTGKNNVDPKKPVEGKWSRDDDDADDGFSGMDKVLSTVLKAVDRKKDATTAGKILPGAKSYDDIEAYLSAIKKEKMEKLRELNKDFAKSGRRW